MKNPRPGEVYKVDLGYEGKVRMVIVVSRYDPDAPRALAMAIPITSQFRDSEYQIELEKETFLSTLSYADLCDLHSLPYSELQSYVGKIGPKVLDEIKMTLKYVLDLE